LSFIPEDIREGIDTASDLANIGAYGQRQETNARLAEQNRLLRLEQAERRRVQSLPRCPKCKITLDHQPSVCRGCGAEFWWDTYWDTPNCVLKENRDQYLKQEYAEAHETLVSHLSMHVVFIESTVDSMARTQRMVEDRISSRNKYLESFLDEPISGMLPALGETLIDEDPARDVSGSPLRLFLMGFWWSTFGSGVFYITAFLGFGSAYLLWDRNLWFWVVCLLWIVCVLFNVMMISCFVDGFTPFVNSLRKTGTNAKINACRKAGLTAHIKESFAIEGELGLRTSIKHIRGLNRISWLRGSGGKGFPTRSKLERFVAKPAPSTSLHDCTLRWLSRTLHEDRLQLMQFEKSLLSGLLQNGHASASSFQARCTQLDDELHSRENKLSKRPTPAGPAAAPVLDIESINDQALDALQDKWSQGDDQGINYWLKRADRVSGPKSRQEVVKLAEASIIKLDDEISNSKDGPWKSVTKEDLQQILAGSDIEIK
jgi:hypothetical protein